MNVCQAVRFSISIPMIFSFRFYKAHIFVHWAIRFKDALFKGSAGNGSPAAQQCVFVLKAKKKHNILITLYVVDTENTSAVDFRINPKQNE